MKRPPPTPPNIPDTPGVDDHLALVLSGGGARAAYQVGVLVAIAEHLPQLTIPILTGVSAGSINTAHLAAHPGDFRSAVTALRSEWSKLTPDRVYCVRPVSVARAVLRWLFTWIMRRRKEPAVIQGLMDMRPLRVFLSECIDFAGIDNNIGTGRLRAVALTTTSYTTGRTVTFIQGEPGCPIWSRSQRIGIKGEITVDHVIASSAIPIVFPAVRLGDGFYGDGSVRQMAPLAPAIHLGARRILAISMRSKPPSSEPVVLAGEYPAMAEVMALLFNAVFLDSLDGDAERLVRINQLLENVPPGGAAPGGIRPVELFMVHPSRDLGELSRGLAPRLPGAVRAVVDSMGGQREGSKDFLSYLLFDPAYTDQLVDLGYSDTCAQWGQLEAFLGTV